ncbi:MAG: ribosome silencing factor [bacterium]
MLTPYEIAEIAVKALDAKKAMNIKVLETHDVTILADYFVLCTATSSTHLKSLADEVEDALKNQDEAPLRTEGYRSGGWILVDFGCVVVHIFTDEARKYYNLEHLWQDAGEKDISALLGA